MDTVNGLFLKGYFAQFSNGYWINEDKLEQTEVEKVVYTKPEMISNNNAFIAMTKETFLRGSQNKVYTKWFDSHDTVLRDIEKVSLLIVEKEIQNVTVPQYVVSNSYEFMRALGKANREQFSGKIISVTGTVGKTNVVELLRKSLKINHRILTPQSNYNSRTAIRCMLASMLPGLNYDFVILEVAVSALWYGDEGITSELKSDYAIFTQFGRGQNGTSVTDTIKFKTRLAKNMSDEGTVILNHDVENYLDAYSNVETGMNKIFTYSLKEKDTYSHFVKTLSSKEKNIVCFEINGKEYKFQLSLMDTINEGGLSNLLSVLTLLSIIGENLEDYQDVYFTFEKRAHFLEEKPIKLGGQAVTLIDDTYNAEELSMMNAFAYIEKIATRFTGKNIAVLGKIINLDNQKEIVYQKIADRLNDGIFDEVCTFGDEGELIFKHLLPSVQGRHFTDITTLKSYLARSVTPNSVILVKGSVNGTQMRQVIPKLLDQENSRIKDDESNSVYWGTDKKYLGDGTLSSDYGLGHLLIIHEVLFRLQEKIITLNDLVPFPKNALELNSIRSTKGKENEQRYLGDVLSQAVSLNAPDTILALACFLYTDNTKAIREIKRKAEKIGVNLNSVTNITGRINRKLGQKMTIVDLKKAGELFKEIDVEYLKLLKNRNWLIHGKQFLGINPLDQRISDTASFFWGSDYSIGVLIDFSGGKTKIVVGMTTNDHQDIKSKLYYLLENKNFSPRIKEKIQLESGKINVLGDVYFGEWYSEKRKRINRNDALMEKGYGHSFDKIAGKFGKDDLNIVNFEAVFPSPNISGSPIEGIKPFNLYAEPVETLSEFKKRNIQLVSFATNHTFDFGQKSIEYSLDRFKKAGIQTLGAGKNQSDAYEMIEVTYKKQTIAIFNGYWYRRPNERRFNGYAYGRQSGVASLTSLMMEIVKEYKRKKNKNKVLIICHWGVDFKEVHPEQQKIAKKLTEAGADLILGHGPHFIQPIEEINQKKVLFSVGNGVFNSDGEFDERNIPPFGLLTQLDLENNELRLYPMYIHNKMTFWQPFLLNDEKYLEDFKRLDFGVLTNNKIFIDEMGYYYIKTSAFGESCMRNDPFGD